MRVLIIFQLGLLLLTMQFSSCKKTTIPNTLNLQENWFIQSGNRVKQSGNIISSKEFNSINWIKTSVPNTILAGMVEAGIYNDIYKDKALEEIDQSQFDHAWWYQTKFNLLQKQEHRLILEGINYRANIWLNGNLLADTSTIEGPFGIWKFDITGLVNKGDNYLAIQVYPPKYDDLTIGFVDWNPAPPDKNLGIWRPVKIETTGYISLEEPFVKTKVNTETLNEAELTISCTASNHSTKRQTVTALGEIGDIKFTKQYILEPKEIKTLHFTPDEFEQLKISNPKLWWPNLMGEQNLHILTLKVLMNGELTDQKEVRFGIRKIENYWNEDGHKGFMVNGKKVLIKGAGWVDDMLLADADDKVAAQMEYVKHMNLNCVRLEGFWGRNQTLYNKADELGLLLMVGWSCQWEWEGYCGRPEDNFMSIRSPKDMQLQTKAYCDQVKWLRNHPSIFTWVYGSDKLPLPELEIMLNENLHELDPDRPTLASCKYEDFDARRNTSDSIENGYANHSIISGPTGVKMLGPYAYTAPSYWYLDHKAGGAYGFNTETGPGPQVPPIESINRMISSDKQWPLNEFWDYHSGRNEFATLKRYLAAFNNRYGKANSAEDFAFRSQISNYEAIRAMFEAFEVNKPHTTGIIQWMLNSAWPELYWQLFDWYLMPNAAFYGTKKACQPLNAIYNYANNSIYVGNSQHEKQTDLTIRATVYNSDSKIVFNKATILSIEENSVIKTFTLPDFKDISTTYFLRLSINKDDQKIASNFYWLSTKPDVHDWENSKWFYTPYKSYADFSQLNTLQKTKIQVSFKSIQETNGDVTVEATLNNKGTKIAFFIELSVKDKATNQTILPVFWDDNYISLIPGEKQIIKAKLQKQYVFNKELSYSYSGLNLLP